MDSDISKNTDPYLEKNFERETWTTMIQNFYRDMSGLVEKEGQLIRAEMSEKTEQIKVASVSMAVGGVMLAVGVLCFAATAIILLDLVAELWVASAIVTVVFLCLGGILLFSAIQKLEARKLKPNRSIEAFGEFGSTLKEKMHEITKH